jgi:UDPglucose 6-dehydrogenase
LKANLKKGDQISLLGLSFKPNTDDVRDSTSLKIAKLLQDRSIVIKSYDPEAMDNAKKKILNYNYATALMKRVKILKL